MRRKTISLYHRIERALATIAAGSNPLKTIQRTAHFMVEVFAEDLGLPRLKKLVKKRRTLEPDALVDLIYDEVGVFSNGAEAADDRTVMVVQRRRGEANA